MMEIYKPSLTSFRLLGVIPKNDNGDFRPISYQGLILLVFHLYIVKIFGVLFYWIGKKDALFILFYFHVDVACLICFYTSLLKRAQFIAVSENLEKDARPNEKRLIGFLIWSVFWIAWIGQLIRILICSVILRDGREFESFVNLFWFNAVNTLPSWCCTALVMFDLVCGRFLLTMYFIVGICNTAVGQYHVVMKYQNLKWDIEDHLTNEREVTTADIVRFRQGYAKISCIVETMNAAISTTMGLLGFQFGTAVFTFILMFFRDQTLEATVLEAIEMMGITVTLALAAFSFIYVILRLDDRALYPVTGVRKLSSLHPSVEDPEFCIQLQALVDQIMDRPQMTVANFFEYKREAIIHVVGAVGTYFMALLEIDSDAQNAILSFATDTNFDGA